ncbi:TetR/AcrR family transcriptional regulator [Novacetimonas cocois]|uniref:TetR family transcriptional regulator n=1 Tax=Novacetimonas cocois TaxID=1747507 RepID=A0A365YX52_9PROT|nr:TetR/AcrR family transcriptional regulator [Novacetimonas cocois]RBM07682.1 TetR family transcriptional regulator [Novacetimonas cocois]
MAAAPPPPGRDHPPVQPVGTTATGTSPAKRAQILAGAARIFAEHGYEGASMSCIARDAGVSKGTLYNYFDSKAVLFCAFIEQCTREKLPLMFRRIDEGATLAESLEHVATALIQLIISPISLMLNRVIVSEAGNFPELAQTFWTHGPQQATSILAAWLARAPQSDLLDVPDPLFAAEQFYALCQTHIAGRARMQLPVDTSDEYIAFVARSAVRVFLNTYQRDGQRLPPLPYRATP